MEQFSDDVNLESPQMILAGDIGGTKTLIGLFEPSDLRPLPVDVGTFPTTEYSGLPAIIAAFMSGRRATAHVTAAAFGVAGPVIDQSAQMTNVVWRVVAAEVAAALSVTSVHLLNDLEAMAYAVPLLEGEELRTLQAGVRRPEGNIAIIAAGTGLGGALLHRLDGRYIPVASEVGHSDFPARTDRELEFVRFIREREGRAEIEHALCGPGLQNLAEFTHRGESCPAFAATAPPSLPARIASAALDRTCGRCVDALEMFVEAYGAVAGNLALTAVTTGGVFIGGGIAPRILPALETGRLIAAFNDKSPMRPLLEAMPVHVILNDRAALLGAAVYANDQLRRHT
jgi:glucokinase